MLKTFDTLAAAHRYTAEFRTHWGVYLDEVLVDCSTVERDAELRACSLCEIPGARVKVREGVAVRNIYDDPERWQVRDYVVTPPT